MITFRYKRFLYKRKRYDLKPERLLLAAYEGSGKLDILEFSL